MICIQDVRKAKGMTQAEVAKAANMKRASYRNIECGKRRPSVEMAKRIAGVLGFKWSELFDDGEKSAEEAQ